MLLENTSLGRLPTSATAVRTLFSESMQQHRQNSSVSSPTARRRVLTFQVEQPLFERVRGFFGRLASLGVRPPPEGSMRIGAAGPPSLDTISEFCVGGEGHGLLQEKGA